MLETTASCCWTLREASSFTEPRQQQVTIDIHLPHTANIAQLTSMPGSSGPIALDTCQRPLHSHQCHRAHDKSRKSADLHCIMPLPTHLCECSMNVFGYAAAQDIKLYGIIKIKGFWLPFAFLALGMFLGADVMSDILGIAVGHAWYFFTTLLPRGTGKQYLPTPWYIRWAAEKLELGPQRPAVSVTAPPGQRPQGAPPPGQAQDQGGFRAFRGTARRLGSS